MLTTLTMNCSCGTVWHLFLFCKADVTRLSSALAGSASQQARLPLNQGLHLRNFQRIFTLSGWAMLGAASHPGTSTSQPVIRFEMRSWEWSGPLSLFLPRPKVRGRGLSAQRSADRLARGVPTSPLRRSLSESTAAQAHRRSVR